MLTIKTGLANEAEIARSHAGPNTLVLTGGQSAADLHSVVPSACTAIISFGLCGALAPELEIGQLFVADVLVTPAGRYQANPEWGTRLLAKTKGSRSNWWSSGATNTANNPAGRLALFTATGSSVIDDETIIVAQFAEERGIPWQAMRVVSDCIVCVIPTSARSAIGQDGAWKTAEFLKSVLAHPSHIPELISLGINFYRSLGRLRTAAMEVGPSFQWDGGFTAKERPSQRRADSLSAPSLS